MKLEEIDRRMQELLDESEIVDHGFTSQVLAALPPHPRAEQQFAIEKPVQEIWAIVLLIICGIIIVAAHDIPAHAWLGMSSVLIVFISLALCWVQLEEVL